MIRYPRSVVALLLAASCALVRPAAAAPQTYRIDPEHLSVGFLVMHIGYAKVLGMFREAGGQFTFDEDTGELSDLSITIAAASVFSNHEKRDGHLRGKDFLDVDRHPRIVFRAAGAEDLGDRRYRLDGRLTLTGQTRPVSLDVVWNKSGRYPFGPGGIAPPYVIGLSARGSFKRSDFGIDYAVSNGWVGDEVELIIELEAQRQ